MRVLGVIPARGGSKGVPRKNIRMLAGKPLLAYTIECARAARSLERVILSTEDEEIAEVGRRWGVEVPFLRPVDLAQDDTPTLPVIQHAVRFLEERGERFDAVCLLQPTSPFRKAEWIDRCVALLEESGATGVVTVLRVPPEHHPWWVYLNDESGWLTLSTKQAEPVSRRQDLPPAYHREGSVYVTRRDVLMEGDSLYGERLAGFEVDEGESVNIDGPEDFARAERLLGGRLASL